MRKEKSQLILQNYKKKKPEENTMDNYMPTNFTIQKKWIAFQKLKTESSRNRSFGYTDHQKRNCYVIIIKKFPAIKSPRQDGFIGEFYKTKKNLY